MMIRTFIAGTFLLAGFFLMIVSAIGVIRLPDFFSRLHASSVGETLGIVFAGIGFIVYEGFTLTSVKILLILIAVFLVNPVGTHLIGKAALRSGHKPWKEEEDHADLFN